MIDIDGIATSTVVAYYGYRQAKTRRIVFYGAANAFDDLRKTLHAKIRPEAKSYEPSNHETFVLQVEHMPELMLAITFSDGKAYFGLGVCQGRW